VLAARDFTHTERENFMKILFINHDGSGFADYIEVPHGTTVQELFEREMREAKPENYLIRVNRQPVTRDQVLIEMDRVSFTPTKIEGAIGRRASFPSKYGRLPG
jgi:hypothetical protein